MRTPGPISIVNGVIQGAKGESIACLVSPSLLAGSLLEWKANAEYIVRAVNSHEALLSAAKEVVGEYFSHGGPDTHQGCSEGAVCFVQQAVQALEKAIAQAESK